MKQFKLLSLVILAFFALSCKEAGGVKDNHFTWWIIKADGTGTFYDKYEDNVTIQWINHQYWDTKGKTLGTPANGTNLLFSFVAPITGTETDNFNTMIATGEYPEIIDLAYSRESPEQLYNDGVLLDITKYVETYMPNYVALLDEYPEIKPFATRTDKSGKVHYYSVYSIADNIINPWEGYMYRRDWIVRYGKPTSHVWDWNSAYVKDNGHPKYTPLAEAQAKGDLTGWKANEVNGFSSSEGPDPVNDYTDNVIFPSGKADPYYISDWEWMLDIFKTAIAAEGFAGRSNAYSTSVYYPGYMQSGDLVSSFGGGGPLWYKDRNGNAAFGGDSENFKTYIACLNAWYQKGWLDTQFPTRSSDAFYKINSTGVNQGMVGLWVGGQGLLGAAIRATCSDNVAKQRAMVFGCPLPINDVYGDEAQKFKIPDTLYQQSNLGSSTGFTNKCEGKDLAALFSMLNWMYTREGSATVGIGLDSEKYASMKFDPDLYAKHGFKEAYTTETDSAGVVVYTKSVPADNDMSRAFSAGRMSSIIQLMGNNPESGYRIDNQFTKLLQRSIDLWMIYKSKGYIWDYNTLMNDEESAQFSKANTFINDNMSSQVPLMIMDGLGAWDTYVKKLMKYDPAKITAVYQRILDKSK